ASARRPLEAARISRLRLTTSQAPFYPVVAPALFCDVLGFKQFYCVLPWCNCSIRLLTIRNAVPIITTGAVFAAPDTRRPCTMSKLTAWEQEVIARALRFYADKWVAGDTSWEPTARNQLCSLIAKMEGTAERTSYDFTEEEARDLVASDRSYVLCPQTS